MSFLSGLFIWRRKTISYWFLRLSGPHNRLSRGCFDENALGARNVGTLFPFQTDDQYSIWRRGKRYNRDERFPLGFASRMENKYVALVLFEVESSQVSVSLKGHRYAQDYISTNFFIGLAHIQNQRTYMALDENICQIQIHIHIQKNLHRLWNESGTDLSKLHESWC